VSNRWVATALLLIAAGTVGLILAFTPAEDVPRPFPVDAERFRELPIDTAPEDRHRLEREFSPETSRNSAQRVVPAVRQVAFEAPEPLPPARSVATATADAISIHRVKVVYRDATGARVERAASSNAVIRVGAQAIEIQGEVDGAAGVLIAVDGVERRVNLSQRGEFSAPWTELSVGAHQVRIEPAGEDGRPLPDRSAIYFPLQIRTSSLRIRSIDPSGLVFAQPPYRIQVNLDSAEFESPQVSMFQLHQLSDNGASRAEIPIASAVRVGNAPALELAVERPLEPGAYRLRVLGGQQGLRDAYGNLLAGNDGAGKHHESEFVKPDPDVGSGVRPGISGSTGPYVRFQEFTAPRKVPDGFNPNDKVETRVARLYYYRDAHRVAQIVNRKVRSHHRAGVDVERQLADKARTLAEQRTAARQQAERSAISAAQKARQLEQQLQLTEQSLQRAIEEWNAFRQAAGTAIDPGGNASAAEGVGGKQANAAKIDAVQTRSTAGQLESLANSLARKADALRSQLLAARDAEVAANSLLLDTEASEQMTREEQFRREVSAAHADPDTYAAGEPASDDPVEQVSISVIGEGLIQLRGPLKGINQIRLMIDQIDAPVGQVRVAVHSVQLNGERADRMEVVANQVQKYVQHSRFLTMQSAELLRRAVVEVAAQRAEEARMLSEGRGQADRDAAYLDAFFGQDFLDELATLDSELLRTGNKLLSIHAMDTTSLSSALTLIALARNDTRREILARFEELCRTQLVCGEEGYLEAGISCGKQRHGLCRHPKYCLLAPNARFESLRGFFQSDLVGDDTLTPLQRDVIRLGQIFKSRLITELEYKQRVMERAVIEERLGDRLKELQQARDREQASLARLSEARNTRRDQLNLVAQTSTEMRSEVASLFAPLQGVEQDARSFEQFVDATSEAISNAMLESTFPGLQGRPARKSLPGILNSIDGDTSRLKVEMAELPAGVRAEIDRAAKRPLAERLYEHRRKTVESLQGALDLDLRKDERLRINEAIDETPIEGSFRFGGRDVEFSIQDGDVRLGQAAEEMLRASLDNCRQFADRLAGFEKLDHRIRNTRRWLTDFDKRAKDDGALLETVLAARTEYRELAGAAARIKSRAGELFQEFDQLLIELDRDDADLTKLFRQWQEIRTQVEAYSASLPELDQLVKRQFPVLNRLFAKLVADERTVRAAQGDADASRRPLDHKKFLDMLIDELEEKYIELLEGTRAHTANVDNYIKRLTTALDDDFHTQFYEPAFRQIREASQFYDVQFGQTETTSILANNRELAKVSPAATMEFDLPHRDLLVTEAMRGAKAVLDDVGALANDPTFLALARLKAGQSTASPPAGTSAGLATVRNVLPGLDSTAAEAILPQNQQSNRQLGAALESLIPDPAIYKFETGTGYEIRPVIQPDGQAVVFDFNYMYTTSLREPVRADEKHLGRVKRHFIRTDVQLSNFELREVSRYVVALKAARTSRGVPLFEDIPLAGVLFRPLPSDEKSLQENLILAQATIFPTLFDLMGLRWAPAVADLDALRLQNSEFTVRGRQRAIKNRVYDYASEQVDEFLRIPAGQRRADLYRSQESIPTQHPNGYEGPGLDQQDSQLREGYEPRSLYPERPFIPGESSEGVLPRGGRGVRVHIQSPHEFQPEIENLPETDPRSSRTRTNGPARSSRQR